MNLRHWSHWTSGEGDQKSLRAEQQMHRLTMWEKFPVSSLCWDTATYLHKLKSLENSERMPEEKAAWREISRHRQKDPTKCPGGSSSRHSCENNGSRKKMDHLEALRGHESLKHRRPEIVPVPKSKREKSLLQGHQNTKKYPLKKNDGAKLSLN